MKEGMEIVLIEDNEEDAEQMVKFLRAHVTNPVRHISDGEDAVQYLLFESDSVPKLILLDLVLPKVDGLELYQIIRSEPKHRNLKVVFLVGSARSVEYIESLGLSPDGYLKKAMHGQAPARLV